MMLVHRDRFIVYSICSLLKMAVAGSETRCHFHFERPLPLLD